MSTDQLVAVILQGIVLVMVISIGYITVTYYRRAVYENRRELEELRYKLSDESEKNRYMILEQLNRSATRIESLSSFTSYFESVTSDFRVAVTELRRATSLLQERLVLLDSGTGEENAALQDTLVELRQAIASLQDRQASLDSGTGPGMTSRLSEIGTGSPPAASAYQHAAGQYAHSIKTPLSAIESAIADAEVYIRGREAYIQGRDSHEPDSDNELPELVLGSLAGAKRAIDAIKNILQTGAGLIGEGKVEELSISQLLNQAERMSRTATKAITPVTSLLDGLPPVRVQKSVVLIPLTLLLENAFEAATSPSDRIIVSGAIDTQTHMVNVIVANTGPPIPAAIRRKLFHEQVSSKGNSGRGTGMLVAQEWLKPIGGRIELIESNPDQTRFQLSFPSLQE